MMMKHLFFGLLIFPAFFTAVYGQDTGSGTPDEQFIHSVIDHYAKARQTKDADLLDRILTDEIDQLVSSGTWRHGKKESMEGMMRSSNRNPGNRTLEVEKIRFLNQQTAIADARYEIERSDGSVRRMWSTFVLVKQENDWQIAAIRNMKPAN